MTSIKERVASLSRSSEENFKDQSHPINPATGERKAELERECQAICEKQDFSYDDLLGFSSHMIQLLGGKKEDNRTRNRETSSGFFDEENAVRIFFERSTTHGIGGINRKKVRAEKMQITIIDNSTHWDILQDLYYGKQYPSDARIDSSHYYHVGVEPDNPILNSRVYEIGFTPVESVTFDSYLTGDSPSLFSGEFVEVNRNLDQTASQNVCRKLFDLYSNREILKTPVS